MKIILTGGGTAGHVMPHLALLDKLKQHFEEISYIGSHNGIEKSLMAGKNLLPYYEIETVKLRRNFSLKNLLIPFKLIKGIYQSKKILKMLKPDVIFSKGGFVAVPVCIAAKKLGIPIVSHESDFSLGLANKMIYKKCTTMCCSFKPTCNYGKKCVHTGSAIRKELFLGSKENAISEYKLNQILPTICITGGSLGATSINNLIYKCKNELLKDFNIIHLCGKDKKIEDLNQPETLGKYIQIEFISNPANIFACCDIVCCRAGSNTIFEFLALAKPMLLIPLSNKASRGDQLLNSDYFQKQGYAEFVLEDSLTPQYLISQLKNLYIQRNRYIQNMKSSHFQTGNNAILNEILKVIK